jgi:hypothetical protein
MKIIHQKIAALLFGGLAAIPLTGFAFNSGSDGSFGAINFTNNSTTPLTNTLALPPDGIFNCTSISIGTNCYVNFVPNALNTPVYLLAQSNIVINGIIDVSGQAGATNGSFPTIPGPGGFAGGAGGNPSAGIPAGYGQGPGFGGGNTSQASGGSFGTVGGQTGYQNGTTYGNLLLVPLIGGSGGGGITGTVNTIPGASGGAGGGALILASSTSVVETGNILARGGSGFYDQNNFSGCGSGGGVRIVAPLVSLSGTIDVSGGTNSVNAAYGGNGRVRFDTASAINANVIGNGQGHPSAPIVSYGRSFFVFPPATPQLYFLTAAGTSIPVGTTNAVSVALPSGSPASQVVTLFGTNFLGTVPVQIVATPATGTPFTTNIVLNFPTTNSFVQTNVTINVPAGVPTQLNAYANYYVQP